MTTATKINSLTIIGRRWFDRINGNTYHTSEIVINGEFAHKTEMEYGYDDCYIQTAQEWLVENGFIPESVHHMRIYCQDENNIEYYTTVSDGLKRDL